MSPTAYRLFLYPLRVRKENLVVLRSVRLGYYQETVQNVVLSALIYVCSFTYVTGTSVRSFLRA